MVNNKVLSEAGTYRLQRPGMALALLGCIFLFCLVVAGVILPLVTTHISRPEAAVRIATVIQDFVVFIIPAIGMGVAVTRLPARLLAIDKGASITGICLALLTMIMSIPAMNFIIEWNKGWHLPASMAGIEEYCRALEDSALATTQLLLNGASVGSLIVSVLIVGVLAGFSEELFFRGAFMRTLGMTRINKHVVIWLVAFVFSAFHFQMFGFVPRMLLGAFFGYLLWWSGSLWLPILVHVFNNSIVVIAEYIKTNDPSTAPIDEFGSHLTSATEIIAVIASVILTSAGIFALYKYYHSK